MGLHLHLWNVTLPFGDFRVFGDFGCRWYASRRPVRLATFLGSIAWKRMMQEMARLLTWSHGCGAIFTACTSVAFVVLVATVALASETNQGVELHATPSSIRFSTPEASEQLLVALVSFDGKRNDRTRAVTYTTTSDGIVAVDARGRVVPLAVGKTSIIARDGDLATSIDVEVNDLTNPAPISYQRDVIPILSKAGCNSGGCHGKAEGQNGFKLSVFGFDVLADHQALVLEGRGRRTMPTAPEQSLLLRKGTGELPHGGGRKFSEDSRWYRQLRRWISEGAQLNPLPDDDADRILDVRVEPARVTLPPFGEQQVRVTVLDAAGKWRCVTAEAEYQSNQDVVAEVDHDGGIRATDVPGEAAILVRYLGHVAVCRVTRPQQQLVDSLALPKRNFIDDHVGAKLVELAIQPSELTSDAEFLRRVYLDIIGTLPTPEEARHFLLDTSVDKRSRLSAELLERPEHADYWAQRWADLLQLDVDTVSPPAVVAMVRWLRGQIAKNTPYDQFVRSILTAQGSTFRESATPFFQVQADPEQLARSVSQLFLGVRIECAQCHHHPFERWDQKDYFALAGFFTGVQRLPSPQGGRKIVSRGGTPLVHPRTGEPIPPAGLGAPAVELDEADDYRQALVEWMTDRDNHWFPRTIVNRLWAHYMGRGLVEPVDDLRVTNPASNEPLMDALVEHLLELDYDLKAFTRTLLDSRTYQLSSRSNTSNRLDEQSHSHASWKSVPAEVLLDAISQATGIDESFTGWPAGYRAIQVWDNKLPSHFLDVFGRPSRQTVCACERGTEPSIAQALHLMNSSTTLRKIQDPQGRAAQLAASSLTWDDIVAELYLATLSRFPTDDERSLMVRMFQESGDRREAAEDVLWTLLNTKEFIFNP
jgi:hypothetical protein